MCLENTHPNQNTCTGGGRRISGLRFVCWYHKKATPITPAWLPTKSCGCLIDGNVLDRVAIAVGYPDAVGIANGEVVYLCIGDIHYLV